MKKATRDLNQLLSNIESPMTRLETVQKKYTELLAEMKKLDREHGKSKRRGDQMQKEQEKSKSELGKTATMKDKLEKLCRELTKENKKVKVSGRHITWVWRLFFRTKTSIWRKQNNGREGLSTTVWILCYMIYKM